MSLATQTTQTKTFCVNHPTTETLLHCNKCGKPVCLKCVQRTPVGYRCNECLGMQRAGYYNATSLDYVLAGIISLVLGVITGIAGTFLGAIGLFAIILAIFAGPIAGGIVSEAVRRAISKRRGRNLALVACVAMVIGALAVLIFPALPYMFIGRLDILARYFVNLGMLGFWVFLALAVSTTYARLRS